MAQKNHVFAKLRCLLHQVKQKKTKLKKKSQKKDHVTDADVSLKRKCPLLEKALMPSPNRRPNANCENVAGNVVGIPVYVFCAHMYEQVCLNNISNFLPSPPPSLHPTSMSLHYATQTHAHTYTHTLTQDPALKSMLLRIPTPKFSPHPPDDIARRHRRRQRRRHLRGHLPIISN